MSQIFATEENIKILQMHLKLSPLRVNNIPSINRVNNIPIVEFLTKNVIIFYSMIICAQCRIQTFTRLVYDRKVYEISKMTIIETSV